MVRKILITLLVASASCSRSQETQAPVVTATNEPATSQPPAAAGPKLMPVDEATREPSLVKFRDDLLAAVRRHDVNAVMNAADPKIRTSFGAGGGAAEFRRQLEQPGSRAWSELERILALGGTFQKGGDVQRFWAPYVYSAWPESGPDAFVALAVTDKDVPMHATNDPSSPAIATLSYDIVTPAGKDKFKTADGRVGWVDPKFLRSPIGYRAGLVRKGDTWKMEALVSGD